MSDPSVVEALAKLTEASRELAESSRNLAQAAQLLSMTTPEADEYLAAGAHLVTRQVWVATVPEGDEYAVGPVEVMVEQFGQNAPSIAFRRGGNPAVWGVPYQAKER